MATITAIVHTKNSQATLEACLQSLTFCDAIMVVDQESYDNTLTIAKKYATIIYSIKAIDKEGKPLQIVEQIRNEFLGKVKTDWTLIVDSDEEVPEKLARTLQELSNTVGINGYRLPRKNIIFGKWIEHTGFWPDYIVRFFRTGTGKHPTDIHKQLEVEGKVEDLNPEVELALFHHHYPTITEFITRMNTYTTFEAMKYPAGIDAFKGSYITTFFDQFFSRFFSQQGYKDGMHGLTLSLLLAVYTMVVHMKVWEINKEKASVMLDDIEADVNEVCAHTMYWTANEKLNERPSFPKRLFLLIKRKTNS